MSFFFTKNTNLAHVIKQLDNFPSRHLHLLSLFIKVSIDYIPRRFTLLFQNDKYLYIYVRWDTHTLKCETLFGEIHH